MSDEVFKLKIDVCDPPKDNTFRFHGTMEEFKKYLPELYEKMVTDPNCPEENE